MKSCPNKTLYYYRNKYDINKSIHSAEEYITELETYIPNEIIDEYAYESSFREVLSLVKETFRPDQFYSAITGAIIRLLDQDFIDWLTHHQQELKRQLSWNQVCQLQCNYSGWSLNKIFGDITEKTIREMWDYTDEKQTEELITILNDRIRQT